MDAAELSPGEFSHRVRRCVDEGEIKTVVIDSINGYQAAMPEENALVLHMHELLLYLNRQGAATFMTVAQHGLVGDMQAPVDITYLADTVILLRYFEALGKVRRAISIIKKRTGSHESTIREYRISSTGHDHRRAAGSLPGRVARRPDLPGREQPAARGRNPVTVNDATSERAIILAPLGRDSQIALMMLNEAGFGGIVSARSAGAVPRTGTGCRLAADCRRGLAAARSGAAARA